VFGVGPQELVVIVLLLLVVFGPIKAAGMVRDLGRFANEARGHAEEFKGELLDGGNEDRVKPASDPGSEGAGEEAPERERGGEPPRKVEAPPSGANTRKE